MAAAKAKKSAVRAKTVKSSRQSGKGKVAQKKRVAAPKKRPQRPGAPKARPQKPASRPSVAKKKTGSKRPARPILKSVKKTSRAVARVIKKKIVKPAKAAARKIKAKTKPAPARKIKVKAKPAPAKKGAALKPVKAVATPKGAALNVVPPKAGAPAKGSMPAKGVAPAMPKAVATKAAKSGADGTRKRGRTRIPHDTGPLAAWLPQPNDPRPRPSSFIPAPPRAESPFTTAAPPASSDRLIRPDDLVGLDKAIRTFPIRVDVEQGAGRTFVGAMPSEISIKAGDGIEWDFRYLGGADATVQEVIIELDKPSPFSKLSFRSHKPGSARPHRQLSGPATASSKGRRFRYTIRCLNWIKAEVAKATCMIQVTE